MTQLKGTSSRSVQTGMEVFVRSYIGPTTMGNICMFPFSTPLELEDVSPPLTSIFHARLVQRGPFRQVSVIENEVRSDAEVLWYARNAGFALAMWPTLIYMLDGTGNVPTELDVRIRILDARTGSVLWDVKQCARSEPGPDIDLTWNTIAGQPAQRCLIMAESLAQQFAEFVSQPKPEEK